MERNKPEFTPLIQASATGNTQAVNFLLETDADLEARDHLGRTALIHAVKNGHVRVVEMLVDAGADIEAQDDTGTSALRYANRVKNAEMLDALQGNYTSDEEEDLLLKPKQVSPVQIRQRRVRIATTLSALLLLLISWRVVVFVQRTQTCIALMEAANTDNISGITSLLLAGADPNVSTRGNVTPLIYAAGGGHTEIVNVLLKYHADPRLKDAEGGTALLRAGVTRPDIVEALLQYGADPNTLDKKGRSLLSYACENEGNVRLIHLLLQHGADPNVNCDNGPPLASLIELGGEANMTLVKELLNKGAKPDARDAAGTPALVWIAEHRNLEIAKLLLEKRADPNAKDALSRTALHKAAREEQVEMVRLLLEKGADVNAPGENGATAIMYALSGLINTDRNHRDECGEILRLLISHGANVNARDRLSRTALQFALDKKQFEMALLLKQEGAKE